MATHTLWQFIGPPSKITMFNSTSNRCTSNSCIAFFHSLVALLEASRMSKMTSEVWKLILGVVRLKTTKKSTLNIAIPPLRKHTYRNSNLSQFYILLGLYFSILFSGLLYRSEFSSPCYPSNTASATPSLQNSSVPLASKDFSNSKCKICKCSCASHRIQAAFFVG